MDCGSVTRKKVEHVIIGRLRRAKTEIIRGMVRSMGEIDTVMGGLLSIDLCSSI